MYQSCLINYVLEALGLASMPCQMLASYYGFLNIGINFMILGMSSENQWTPWSMIPYIEVAITRETEVDYEVDLQKWLLFCS